MYKNSSEFNNQFNSETEINSEFNNSKINTDHTFTTVNSKINDLDIETAIGQIFHFNIFWSISYFYVIASNSKLIYCIMN